MSKKKMTDEHKLAIFENWKSTEEYKVAMDLAETRQKLLDSGTKIEIATQDITSDIQNYLDEMHHLM